MKRAIFPAGAMSMSELRTVNKGLADSLAKHLQQRSARAQLRQIIGDRDEAKRTLRAILSTHKNK